MADEERQIVWEAGLDDDKYQVVVERLDERHGQLIVVEAATNKTVLSEKVSLSYGAAFGADAGDIQTWQQLIDERIPAPDQCTSATAASKTPESASTDSNSKSETV